MIHHITPDTPLTIAKVKEIIDNKMTLALSDEASRRIEKCRNYLNQKMETQKVPIYGVTTGFGSLCNISISKEQLSQLQKNLVMSHACGVGDEVPQEVVRLMLLLKAQNFCFGYSGAQLQTVQRLIDCFNDDILPVVYQQGSLGASGDLCPLANLMLPAILGMGEVYWKGRRCTADEVYKAKGWQPIELQSKEGLALLNGTQFMSSYAVWSLMKAQRLSAQADMILSLSLDAFDGRIEPFYESLHMVRPHKGQLQTAEAVRKYTDGSDIIRRHKNDAGRTIAESGIYAYWYFNPERSTPDHFTRLAWIALDNLFRDYRPRWAYVSISLIGRSSDGQSAYDTLRDVVPRLIPIMRQSQESLRSYEK